MRVPMVVIVALATAVLAMDGVSAAVAVSGSCMRHRLYKAGFPLDKVIKYEQSMTSTGLTEQYIVETPAPILRILLRSDLADARNLQDCIAKRSDKCSTYNPCRNGGVCRLNQQKGAFVCVCHKHFTGKFCTTPHSAPLGELRALEKKFSKYKKENDERFKSYQAAATSKINALETKTQYLGDGCNVKTVGYRYHVVHGVGNAKVNGEIARIQFIKKLPQTILGLSYASDIRIINAGSGSLWYFKIDGQECSRPAKIDIRLYQAITNNRHQPAVLKGFCKGTNAGSIGQGQHTITVHVQKTHGNPSTHSGWRTTSTLEVQELCPPF